MNFKHEVPEYVRTSSFEIGTLNSWAVSSNHVCVLANGTEVFIVGEQRDRIELASPAESIALSTHLYAVTEDGVDAYGLSGTRLWRVSMPDADRVAAPDECGLVVVLTGNDELIGLDAISGQERFHVDRPHADVATTPKMVCTDESIVLAAWSFVSVLGPHGESRLRERLDGAISGLGVVGDTIICVMKDARCIGIDIETGKQRWIRDWQIDSIDPFGREEIILRTEGEIRAVDPDGQWQTLALDDGLPVTASSGEPVCIVVDTVINVYNRVGDNWLIDATVLSDSLGANEDVVHVELHNVGDSVACATVELEVKGATCIDNTETFTLTVDELQRFRFFVSDIAAESVGVTVTVNGDPITNKTLTVTGGSEALDINVEPACLMRDDFIVDVSLANTTGVPVEDIQIGPVDEEVGRIDPRSETTVSLKIPTDETLTIANANGIPRKVDVPQPPNPLKVECNTEDDVISVIIRNESTATVVDEITITGELLPKTVKRTFKGGPGSVFELLTVPPTAGTYSVMVTGHYVDHEASLDVNKSAVPAWVPAQEATRGRSSDAPNEAGNSVKTNDLKIERNIDPMPPVVGNLCREYIKIRNVGSAPESVSVTAPDTSTVLETIPAGEHKTFSRTHTFTGLGSDILPAVTIESEGTTRTAREVDTDPILPDLFCWGVVSAGIGSPTIELTFINEGENHQRIVDLSLETFEIDQPVQAFEVKPHNEVTQVYAVSGPDLDQKDSHDILNYNVDNSLIGPEQRQTLVDVFAEGAGGLSTLQFHIDEETSVQGDGGTVAIQIINEGSQPCQDLTIKATGDQVRQILYDEDQVDELVMDGEYVHYIDLEGIREGVQVDVNVSAVVDGDNHNERLLLSGSPGSLSIHRKPSWVDGDASNRISTEFSVNGDWE